MIVGVLVWQNEHQFTRVIMILGVLIGRGSGRWSDSLSSVICIFSPARNVSSSSY